MAFIFFQFHVHVFAQEQEKVWAFGNYAGLDFNHMVNGYPAPIKTAISHTGGILLEGCASVCDDNNELLFYTDGTLLWNRLHQPMKNNGVYCRVSPYTTWSITQAAVIVPVPDTAGKYYVFTLSRVESSSKYYPCYLYYSIVDMRLNGGLGGVDTNHNNILLDSALTEKMIAVPGDHCDIWLITHSQQAAKFHSWHIDASGINTTPVISATGNFPPACYNGGTMKISPDRSKLLVCGGGINGDTRPRVYFGVELCRFDPGTGVVSGAAMLDDTSSSYYSGCFSPDGTKMYVGRGEEDFSCYQYDVSLPVHADIVASRVKVGTNLSEGDFKCGPDGKVYFVSGGSGNVHAIRYPDSPGTACGFTLNAIALLPGTYCWFGLPADVARPRVDTSSHGMKHINSCFHDSVVLSLPGYGHHWSDGSTAGSYAVSRSGSYAVSYMADCTYWTDSFSVQISRLPQWGYYSGCKNTDSSYAWAHAAAGDTATYTYTWYDAAGNRLQSRTGSLMKDTLLHIPHGAYRLQVAAGSGCDTALAVNIAPPQYQASFTADSIGCAGKAITFRNTSSGGLSTEVWDFGDGSTSSQEPAQHIYSSAGTYTAMLVAGNRDNCYDTSYGRIRIDTMPAVAFTADKKEVCAGEAITFCPQYNAATATISWDFNGVQQPGTGSCVRYSFTNSGAKAVTIRAHHPACPDTAYSDTVRIDAYPAVDIGPDTTLCFPDGELTLTNRAASAGAYLWSTGADGAGITVHDYGSYSLTVTAGAGCRAADSVTVSKGCFLAIPNAFTPNGDGANDYFFPMNSLSGNVTSFRMEIFNRWGQRIFETNKTDGPGWDGSLNGTPQPEGVYAYLISVIFANHVSEHRQGNVTLIR